MYLVIFTPLALLLGWFARGYLVERAAIEEALLRAEFARREAATKAEFERIDAAVKVEANTLATVAKVDEKV